MPFKSAIKSVLLAILLLYFVSARGYIEVSDTYLSLQTAQSIVTHGNMEVAPTGNYTFTAKNGRTYSKYGIALPFYFVPIVVASKAIARIAPVDEDTITRFLISFSNIPFALLALLTLDRLLLLFQTREQHRVLLLIAFGLGTLGWRYAVYDYSEEIQLSLLLFAFYGILKRSYRSLLLGGIAFAFLILFKLIHIVFLPVFVLFLFIQKPRKVALMEAIRFSLPVIVGMGVVLFFNLLRFGNPMESGYGSEARQFYLWQIPYALPRLLFFLDKGMFVFSPILLLCLFGWPRFFRRYFWEATLCAVLIVINLLLSAAWHSWEGGWSWGPRLVIPTLPLWVLPLAFFFSSERSRQQVALTQVAILLSIFVQVPGILIKDQEIHEIKRNRMTAVEKQEAVADYPAALTLLRHKLTQHNEVYSLSEFGPHNDRQIDLSSFRTFQGLNVWSEKISEQLHKPIIRLAPVVPLLLALFLLFAAFRYSLTASSEPESRRNVPDTIEAV